MQIAIVGLGFMGSTHVKAALSIPNLQVAVVSRDPEKLKGDLSKVHGNLETTEAHLDFSSVRTFHSLDEVLADPSIDAVDLCLPTALHEPFATRALLAGKHVLVEKPMGLDRAACDRMLAAAASSGKLLMAAQVLRFFPSYDNLKRWVSSGESGSTRNATFRRRCAAPGWGPWLKDKSQSGGGVFDLLIHDIDMALYLFGAPHSVSATGHEDLPNQIDVISAQLFYDNFAVTIAGGWHHGDFPFSMEYTVVADHGTMDFHSSQPQPSLYRSGQSAQAILPQGETDGYKAEIDYFINCARENRQPERCSPLDSARSVSLAQLMLDSRARKGETLKCQL